jgi:hypothetical protein
VNAGETLELEPFCALAVKAMVLPSGIEALVAGFKLIFAGKGEAPGGLLLPQAAKNKKKVTVTPTDAHRTQRNLAMHPLAASRLPPRASR